MVDAFVVIPSNEGISSLSNGSCREDGKAVNPDTCPVRSAFSLPTTIRVC